jgi:hypothetical protein
MSDPLSKERRMALTAMHNLGWASDRISKHTWMFTRPDAGGLNVVLKRSHQNLSMLTVVDIAISQGDAPELAASIDQMKLAWVQDRFFGLYSRAKEIKA